MYITVSIDLKYYTFTKKGSQNIAMVCWFASSLGKGYVLSSSQEEEAIRKSWLAKMDVCIHRIKAVVKVETRHHL